MKKQEQIAQGKLMRQLVKRREQALFDLHSSRKSITEMITASNYDRLPELIPIRHYRMSVSPFAFYRGTAGIMAFDLSHLPHTKLNVQSVGDCHIMNFGGYATPERTLVFDINDFDETHPAPWEWDVKRLATSFVLVAYNNNMSQKTAEEITFSLVKEYQNNLQIFSDMNMLDLWYKKFDFVSLREEAKNPIIKNMLSDAIIKADKKTSQQVFYKITQQVLGNFSITEQPPLVYHPFNVDEVMEMVNTFWDGYLDTLQSDRRFLTSHYRIVDIALKVVGVGSVGTRCYVVLLMNDKDEPLFLQIKEARPSVLAPYTEKSIYGHHGQRVVEGERLIQAASDIFLGWTTGPQGRHFYIRQLKDKKIAPEVENYNPQILTAYARMCGRVLARAHAKTSNAGIISAYIGKNDSFCEAITRFAINYSKQVNIDFEEFTKAIKSGKIPVEEDNVTSD